VFRRTPIFYLTDLAPNLTILNTNEKDISTGREIQQVVVMGPGVLGYRFICHQGPGTASAKTHGETSASPDGFSLSLSLMALWDPGFRSLGNAILSDL